jgi:hypothetical protein
VPSGLGPSMMRFRPVSSATLIANPPPPILLAVRAKTYATQQHDGGINTAGRRRVESDLPHANQDALCLPLASHACTMAVTSLATSEHDKAGAVMAYLLGVAKPSIRNPSPPYLTIRLPARSRDTVVQNCPHESGSCRAWLRMSLIDILYSTAPTVDGRG